MNRPPTITGAAVLLLFAGGALADGAVAEPVARHRGLNASLHGHRIVSIAVRRGLYWRAGEREGFVPPRIVAKDSAGDVWVIDCSRKESCDEKADRLRAEWLVDMP